MPPCSARSSPFQFFFRRNPQTHGFVDEFEHDERHGKGPDETGSDAQQLNPDNTGRRSADVENSGGQGAPGAIHAMDGNCADRVIDLDFVEKQDRKDHQDAGNGTDNNGAAGQDVGATR